ncbi:MAG: hypothetical protein E7188_00675 [Erysipelotrichaceae bacterium]|nr:hypothetical protein [Erysipelotrichaceae bacterium]
MKKLFLIIVVLAMISCFGNARTSSRRTAARTHSQTETVQRQETAGAAEEETQPEVQESPVPEQAPAAEEPAPVTADTSSQDFEAFKRKMDDLEAFFDSYVEFCKAYDVSDTGMMLQYLDMMNKYNDAMKALDSIDESNLTPEEDAYYTQTLLRIDQKLIEAANALNQ